MAKTRKADLLPEQAPERFTKKELAARIRELTARPWSSASTDQVVVHADDRPALNGGPVEVNVYRINGVCTVPASGATPDEIRKAAAQIVHDGTCMQPDGSGPVLFCRQPKGNMVVLLPGEGLECGSFLTPYLQELFTKNPAEELAFPKP